MAMVILSKIEVDKPATAEGQNTGFDLGFSSEEELG